MKIFSGIVLGIGFVFIVIGLFMIFNKDEEVVLNTDSFLEEYPEVGEDHLFSETDIDSVIDILSEGTGVVYIGFPECPWCQAYVPMLNEVGREVNLDLVYYLNIKEDRSNNTSEYLEIVSILEDYLDNDDEGNPRIYVPTVVVVVDGEIVGFDSETSLDTGGFSDPVDYWTEDEVNDLKTRLNGYLTIAVENGCSACDF